MQTAQVHGAIGREDIDKGDCLQSRASGSASESEAEYDTLVDDGSEVTLSSSGHQSLTTTTISDDLSDSCNVVDDCFDDIRCTMMMLERRLRRPHHVAEVCEAVGQNREIHGGSLPSNCYSVGAAVSLVCDWETKKDAPDSWSCPGRLGSTSRINISMSCNSDCRDAKSGSNICLPMQIDEKSGLRESTHSRSCSNTLTSSPRTKKDCDHSGEEREEGGVPTESLTDVTSVGAMSEGGELPCMDEDRPSHGNVAKTPLEEHPKQPATDDIDTADVNSSEIISEIEHGSLGTSEVGSNQSCAIVDESTTRVVSSSDSTNEASRQNDFVEPDRVAVGLFVRPSGPDLGTVSSLVDQRQNDLVEPDRVADCAVGLFVRPSGPDFGTVSSLVDQRQNELIEPDRVSDCAVGLFVRSSGPDLGTVSALVDQYQTYYKERHDASNKSNSTSTGLISVISAAAEMIKEKVTLVINDIESKAHETPLDPSPGIHQKQSTSDCGRRSSSPIERQPSLLSNANFEARLLDSVQSVRTDIDEIKRVISAIQIDLHHCSR